LAGVNVKVLWAYVYQIVTLQPWTRLGTIRTLLNNETAASRSAARSWAGRLLLDRNTMRILIVGDSPEQNREVNRRLETQLKNVGAGYSITAPMAIWIEGGLSPA
jgi:hypothetical protein